MAEHFDLVIEALKKEKKEFVLNFTPKDSNFEYKIRNRFNDVTFCFQSRELKYVRYGYYEIKNSSLGPIIFLVDDEQPLMFYEDLITVKVPAIKWVLSVRENTRTFNETLDFIHRMPKVETKLSTKEAKHLYDTYENIPLPENAKNVKAPDEEHEGSDAEVDGAALEFFNALCKAARKRRPFEPSDFVKESFIPSL